MQDRLRTLGHSITQDWLNDGVVIPPGFGNDPELTGKIAEEDIDGVLNADAFIILTSNEKPGMGMCVEFGAALARAELGTLPHVLAVGGMKHETVFYWHPSVRRLANVDEVVAYIEENA